MNPVIAARVRSHLNRLTQLGCSYAFHYSVNGEALDLATAERFPSASVIKIPILLAWQALERRGELDRAELCDLDAEPQVEGAGLSWLLRTRRLPYSDCLLLMIALSDNLCTNVVIERIGMERLNRVMADELGLAGTQLQRKLMDLAARERGLDNFITAADGRRLYALIAALPALERAWVDDLLLANHDDTLLKRSLPRDSLDLYHKSGSIPGVLHDWGYTREREMFLFTQAVAFEHQPAVFEVFGVLGELLARP